MEYDEASSDSEMDRRADKRGKRAKDNTGIKGQKGAKGGNKGQKGKGRNRNKDDDSETEEKNAREILEEQTKNAKVQHFNALGDSSEGEEDEDQQEKSQNEDDADRVLNAFLQPLEKDLKLFGERLKTLVPLQSHPDLTEDGEQFLFKYESLLKTYLSQLCLAVMFACKGDDTHPVFRKVAGTRELVKRYDKIWRLHRAEFEGWSPEEEIEDAAAEGEEEGVEEGLGEDEVGDEEMDIYDDLGDEDFEEDEDEEVVAPRAISKNHKKSGRVVKEVQGPPQRVHKKVKEGFVKRKVQTFKLEAPKSYLETFHYNPQDEVDEDDRVLNLGKRKALKPLSDPSDEITLGDMKAMESHDALESKLMKKSKVAKPSEKGKKLYEELAKEKSKTQSLSNALNREMKAELDKFERKLTHNERRINEDEPRTLTQAMTLNQGLKRKRDSKISRVKLREKYERAKRIDASKKGIGHVRRKDDMLTGTGDAVNREIKLY
jgi:hypothetical protein